MDNQEYPPAYTEKPPLEPGFGTQPIYPAQPAYSPGYAQPQAPAAQEPLMQQPPVAHQQPMMPGQPMMAGQPVTQPIMITTQGGRACHGGPSVVTAMPIIGSQSVRMKCPHCQNDIDTSTEKSATVIAMISAIGLFLFGCVCGCCLIPLCMDDCKSVEHSCPSCRRMLGKYQKY